jgi:uncharacterized protein
MAGQGIPSHWNVWVASDSAAETVERAAAAGGQVLMPPMTLGPSGTLAMVADPGGAAIGVWQADQHIGAGVVGEPGAMTWWEVNTRSFEACKDFYGQVFGWDAEPLDAPGVTYAIWKLDGEMVGGMLEMNEQWEGIPSSWMVYFAVAGTDEAAGRVAATATWGPGPGPGWGCRSRRRSSGGRRSGGRRWAGGGRRWPAG